MNYELAKELKDAGFPQHESSTAYSACEEDKCFSDACVPTLEELIEACGQRFWKLLRDGDKWIAYVGGVKFSFSEGDTPTEAVARLWLALNKKS